MPEAQIPRQHLAQRRRIAPPLIDQSPHEGGLDKGMVPSCPATRAKAGARSVPGAAWYVGGGYAAWLDGVLTHRPGRGPAAPVPPSGGAVASGKGVFGVLHVLWVVDES